jgi:antitoxin HicB
LLWLYTGVEVMEAHMVNKNRDYYLNLSYPIRLYQRSQGDEEYWFAEIPDLPGCVADGATPDEAVRSVKEAKVEWIDGQMKEGHEIPEPAVSHPYSGRLLVRIPKSLHARLAEEARVEGVSINQTVAYKLASKIGESVGREECRAIVANISSSQAEFATEMSAQIHDLVSTALSEVVEKLVEEVSTRIDERVSAATNEAVEKIEMCINRPNASLTPWSQHDYIYTDLAGTKPGFYAGLFGIGSGRQNIHSVNVVDARSMASYVGSIVSSVGVVEGVNLLKVRCAPNNLGQNVVGVTHLNGISLLEGR